MKKFIPLLLLLLTINVIAENHKVKAKNQVASIDKIPFIKWDCSNIYSGPCILSSVKSEEKQIVLNCYFYMAKDKRYENGVWVTTDVRKSYYQIKFIKEDLEMYSNKDYKRIFEMMYDAKVFNEDGTTNTENVKKFVSLYGESKPNVVIIN